MRGPIHLRRPTNKPQRRRHFGRRCVYKVFDAVRYPYVLCQYIPNSIACRLYLVTVLIETAIDLAIESDLLVRFHQVNEGKDNVSEKMPVYLTIFALAQYVKKSSAQDST